MAVHAPALEAPTLDVPPARPVETSHDGVARRATAPELLVLGLVATTAALAYGLIHRELAIQANTVYAHISPYAILSHPGREAITTSFGSFLAVLLGSSVLAASRHRIAAFGIFALAAATPLVQAVLGALPADRCVYFRVGPNPLGTFWTTPLSRPGVGELWRASAIDYGLAFLPAVAIAMWMLRAERPTTVRTPRPTRPEAAGLACSSFAYWLVLHTWDMREALRGTVGPGIRTDLVTFLPFFLLGVVLARGSRWRLVALAGVPILWATTWVPHLLIADTRGFDPSDVHNVVPFVLVVVAGALWRPVASLIDGRQAPGWLLVAALNALNLADVLFTRAAVHSGQAVEANPIATWIGPGLKLAGVGIASVLVARLRPRALIWLVVAFVAVITWHLSGVVLDTA